MFKKFLLVAFAAVTSVRAAPTAPSGLTSSTVTDTDILQYALTLEHLENAFYSTALAEFDADAFAAAGYPPEVRARFVQIGQHEGAHVKFLSDALGSKATQPCIYSFPTPDVHSFTVLSAVLENLGVSAYAGAAHLISSPNYLTSAATILSVEARHAAWVAANADDSDPFPQPFDDPLPGSAVLVLAFQFIVPLSCPSSNPTLPFDVQPFPTLTLSEDSPAPGASIIAHFTPVNGTDTPDGPAYVAWVSGLGVEYSELGHNGETTVPHGLNGTVYALAVSSKNAGMPSAANLLSGLTVAQVSQNGA
ncbi:ferritin-like domain-containing protein [Cerioporus squamosus]|nr:ferritin-like domain-containing protein [Cerioporus squamosus]